MQNCNYSTTDMNKEIANMINVAVVAGYKVMYNNYGGPSEHPSDYAFNRYATELKAGILLLETEGENLSGTVGAGPASVSE